MAEKKTTKRSPERTYKGDILRGEYDEEFLENTGRLGKTRKRKVRYWCFTIQNCIKAGRTMPDYPKGLKEFVEGLPGFAGWEYFAVTWDIEGENPFKVVLRLQSVWEEWEAVMDRVAIPIDTPPEQISMRIQALTDEYARKNGKKRK